MTTLPTVHLNGTSRAHLVETYLEALVAVRNAIKVLHDTAPNERDYYVTSAIAFERARTEHVARLHKLETVEHELNELWKSVKTNTRG